jgi:hypothetical protein
MKYSTGEERGPGCKQGAHITVASDLHCVRNGRHCNCASDLHCVRNRRHCNCASDLHCVRNRRHCNCASDLHCVRNRRHCNCASDLHCVRNRRHCNCASDLHSQKLKTLQSYHVKKRRQGVSRGVSHFNCLGEAPCHAGILIGRVRHNVSGVQEEGLGFRVRV